MENKPQALPKKFSNLTGMGSPVQVFLPKTSMAINVIIILLLLLSGGGAIAYALNIFWQRWGRYYPPVIYEAMAPWVIGALIAFVIAILIIRSIYRRRKLGAVVFTNGFAYSDHKGIQTWRWDQVQDVTANVIRHYTNGIYTGTTHIYTLVKTSGEKLVINDNIKDVGEFYNHLQNNTLQYRYQRLADAYNRGETVTFGPVTIGKQGGIKIGKKTFPWDQVEQVTIEKGVLSVKKKDGGWFSGATATAETIPNLHVLLSIINQIVGLNPG